MKISWFGHSSFLIETSSGIRIITDPYSISPKFSYAPLDAEAEIVTVSHSHWDHSGISSVKGFPVIFDSVCKAECMGVGVEGLDSSHDSEDGRKRGRNTIFSVISDGLKIVHMGDIGEIPSEKVFERFAAPDLLLIPIGGVYTTGPSEAAEITKRLKPRVVMPMHYANSKCTFVKYTAADFAHAVDLPLCEAGESYILDSTKKDGVIEIISMESLR